MPYASCCQWRCLFRPLKPFVISQLFPFTSLLSFCRAGVALEQAGERGTDTDICISPVPHYFALASILPPVKSLFVAGNK